MSIALKDTSYLTLEETKTHLGVRDADVSQDDKITRLINMACRKVETYIEGPVKTRQFVEQRDGTDSSVIVPSLWPLVSLVELRIDYNRQFDNVSIIDLSNVLKRGSPDLRQADGDEEIRIIGTDIVLWDDQTSFVLGQLFAGSAVQSIKLTYTAGWGLSADDLPDDLVYATLMIVEFFYYLHSNKDMGITGRTSMNQSYTRHKQGSAKNGAADPGLPPEVTAMLDPYKDASLGITDIPQRNSFV